MQDLHFLSAQTFGLIVVSLCTRALLPLQTPAGRGLTQRHPLSHIAALLPLGSQMGSGEEWVLSPLGKD